MKKPQFRRWCRSPFVRVLRRECKRMISRRIYAVSCIILPLFTLFFMATIFGNGQMEELPVGVVDDDFTPASRGLVRQVEAVPTLRVTSHYANEAEARADVRRKRIYGYLCIPSGFEAKVNDGKPVSLTFYYHYALLSVGSEIRAAFQSLLKQASAFPLAEQAQALGIPSADVQTFLLPVRDQVHPLVNPDMDYSVYLTPPFFYVLLQVLLLLVTTYALGSERKFHTASAWLAAADGRIGVAVVAKLLPYTVIFLIVSVLANWVYFAGLRIPCQANGWMLLGLTCLFLLATQAFAVTLYALFPVLGLVISVVSMMGSLGATLCGVTFPVNHMYAPVYHASFLFPVRHFVVALQQMLYAGEGGWGSFGWSEFLTTGTWKPVVWLLGFLLLPCVCLPRMKQLIRRGQYESWE